MMENVHWATPALMVGWLLGGATLAMAHHFFYNNLNGQPIESQSYSLSYLQAIASLSNQAINIAIGTTFAFLVKTCLSCAARMAYTQLTWKIARSQATKVAVLDSMFSMTSNILGLFHGRLWLSHPLMMLLALLTWLLPLASLVSPGTLTVSLRRYDGILEARVPMLDFTRLTFANVLGGLDGHADPEIWSKISGEYDYAGPQDAVNKVVTGTVFGGQMSSMTPPLINSSWELNFPGPAIRCNTITGPDKSAIVDNIWQASTEDGCKKTYAYVAWIPHNKTGSLPFPMNATWSMPYLESSSSFYVAVLNQMLHSWDHISGPACRLEPGFDTQVPPAIVSADANIMKCELQNVSYHTTFSYENGVQTVGISIGQSYNDASTVGRVLSLHRNKEDPQLAQEDLRLASSNWVAYNDRRLQFGVGPVDKINPMATLAYQSLMDSFQKPLLGAIFNEGNFENGITATDTRIMSTILSNQPELAFIRNFIWEVPHQSLEDNDRSRAYFNRTVLSNLTLARALEQLFQNVTISLLSNEQFQYNTSLPGAPRPIEIQTWTVRNVYVYGAPILWISYGLALAFSTAGVMVGLAVMGVTGVAFSNNFSTYLRTIRRAGLSLEIHSSDIDGADPVPKYLAGAQVAFFKSVRGVKSEDGQEGQTDAMLVHS